MNKSIHVGLAAGKTFLLIIPLSLLVLAASPSNAGAQTLATLYSFSGPPNDGFRPNALIQGSDGNFYGTTRLGGTNDYGTVFRISPDGNETNLHSFGGSSDGMEPFAGLMQASDGNFYGTTPVGGSNNLGTIFRISPSGTYTMLYSLVHSPTPASAPCSPLIQASDGNFYGTTDNGGTFGTHGTAFQITPSGTYTTLCSILDTGIGSGLYSQPALVLGGDGYLYGTTFRGGSNGQGSVFRITTSGTYTSLYSFGASSIDGTAPNGLVRGSNGKLYGTTAQGGTYSNGTVFCITLTGSYSNLYSFGGTPNDGLVPLGVPVQGSDGNFYGTTYYGGTSNVGTVFRFSPNGTETVLCSLASLALGSFSPSPPGLVQGSDGIFYGTTGNGGASTNCPGGCGTVFKLTVPLNPPANQISAVQVTGADVAFSIPSVACETYQLQFSNSMNPTNWINVPGVSVTNSLGALLTLTNSGSAIGPQRFYRFDITP
ncbi:MAG TPA: choice-of-anchor tandem repeat GloVer-containing protein [Verrucomicrobiae bacterium]|nr:choice-of-anchor tandem repeat GloVer-containing protein [Verrucomicrobiae bacterium]